MHFYPGRLVAGTPECLHHLKAADSADAALLACHMLQLVSQLRGQHRQAMLLLLINRITDLEEWSKGRLVRLDAGMAEQKAAELEEALTRLRVKMGLCLYVIQEEYRPRIMDAHRAYFDFFDANGAFLELISKGDRSALLGEKLLQANRIAYITGVHYQGCRFFRREREE